MRSVANGRASVERNVAPHILLGFAVIRLWVQFTHIMRSPHLFTHHPATCCEIVPFTVSASVKYQRIVRRTTIGSSVRVYRHKEVHVVGIHFLTNFAQWSVVFQVIGRVRNIRIGCVFCTRKHDVLAFYAHFNKFVYHRQCAHQVGRRLVKALFARSSCFG